MDVNALEKALVARQRHLGHAMVNHVGSPARFANAIQIADIALYEIDLGRPIIHVNQIEIANRRAAREQHIDQQRAKVARAAGHQNQTGF